MEIVRVITLDVEIYLVKIWREVVDFVNGVEQVARYTEEYRTEEKTFDRFFRWLLRIFKTGFRGSCYMQEA